MAQVDPQRVKTLITNSSKTLDDIINTMVHTRLSNMYTMLPARVLKFYPEEMRADVLPLLQGTDINGVEQNSSPTTNVPVIFPNSKDIYIRTPLEEGDLVMVSYSTVALDELLETDVPTKPQSKRRFSQKDGVVLGGYRYDSGAKTLTGCDRDLVLHRRSTDTIIKITDSGNVEITGAKKILAECEELDVKASSNATIKSPTVKIDSETTTATGNLVVEKSLTVAGGAAISGGLKGDSITTNKGTNMDNHTHDYNPGPGAPTSTTPPK